MRNRLTLWKPNSLRIAALCLFVAGVLLLVSLPTMGQAPAARPAGSITALIPQDFVNRGREHIEAAKDAKVFWNDEIETMRGGRVRVTLQDGSVLNIGSQTKMRVLQHDEVSQQSSLALSYGKVRASVVQLTKPDSKFEVRTPQAVCGVVGTDEYLDSTPASTTVLSLQGTVTVGSSNPNIPGTVMLGAFQMTTVATGRAPTPPTTAPVEVVRQALDETAAVPSARLGVAEGMQGDTIQTALEGQHLLPVSELKITGTGVTVTQGTGATDTRVPITIVIAAAAAPGIRTITLKTPSGEVAANFLVRERPAAPSFTLSSTPTADQSNPLALGIGGSPGALAVAVQGQNQFAGSVTLSVEGLPAGVTLSPATVVVAAGASATLQVAAGAQATVGAASFTLVGTSGTLRVTRTIYLMLAPAPSFTLISTPTADQSNPLPLGIGGSPGTLAIAVQGQNRFAGSVTLSAEGLPTGVTLSPATTAVAAGASASLQFTASAQAVAGTVSFTLVGTSGTLRVTQIVSLMLVPPPAAVIGGEWWYRPDAPSQPITPPSLNIALGARVRLDGSGSTATGSSISRYSWQLENTPQQSTAASFDIDTSRLTPGSYRATLRVTNALGSSARAEIQIMIRALPDPADVLQGLRGAYESLQISQFMSFFDSSFRGAGALEENMRNFLQTVNSVRVYLRIDNSQASRDDATFQAAFQITFSTKQNPGTSQQRLESLTVRMRLIREMQSERWLVTDFGATVSNITSGQGTASGSAVVAPQASTPSTVDLVISSFQSPTANLVVGSTATLSATVTNRGTGPASQVVVAFSLGGRGIARSSTSDPLAAGASVTVSASAVIPDLVGAQTLNAVVNPDLTVAESDTTNNASQPVSVNVVRQGFTLALDTGSATRTVLATQSASYVLRLTSVGGFVGAIQFSLSGLPSGATFIFSPSVNLTADSSATTTLTVQTTADAPAGSYALTVTATSGPTAQTLPLTLVVQNFTLEASPSTASTQAALVGQSASFPLLLTAGGGFSATVQLAASNLPVGASASFSPASLAPSASGSAVTLTVQTGSSTPAQDFTLSVNATSGSLTRTLQVTLRVQNFTVSVTPAGQNISPGGSAAYSVSVNGVNGFGGSVNLAVDSLPPGITARFSSTSVTAGGGPTTLSVDTTASVAEATYALFVSATFNVSAAVSVTRTASADLIVGPPPGFSVAINPTTASVGAGAAASFTATFVSISGFSNTVNLSLTGAPTNTTVAITPQSLIPTSAGATAQILLTTSATTPAGNYPLVLTASDGTIQRTASFTLTVTAPTFTLAASPGSASVSPGQTASFTLTLTALGSFAASVNFTTAGLPSGTTAAFNPSTVVPSAAGSTVQVSIATGATTPAGTFSITVTASGGGITQTADVTLAVVSLGSFSLTASAGATSSAPIGLSIGSTQPASVTIGLVAAGGFNASVALTVANVPSGVTVTPTSAVLSPGQSAPFSILAGAGASTGAGQITFNAVSGSLSANVTVFLDISSFSLASSPSNSASTPISLIRNGASVSVSINVQPLGSFTSSVTVAPSTVPLGVTVTPTSATVAPGTSANFTLSADLSAAVGLAEIDFNGTFGTNVQTAAVFVNIIGGTFTLQTQPATSATSPLAIALGTSSTLQVLVVPDPGFTGTVNLTVSGLPAGITASPFSASVNVASVGVAAIQLVALSSGTTGSFTATITASSSSFSTSVTVELQVIDGFALSTTPATSSFSPLPVNPGGTSGTPFTVNLSASSTFTSTVSLSIGPLPGGVTISPATASIAPSGGAGSAAFTLFAAANVIPQSFSFAVTGTAGASSRTILVFVTVTQPGGFALAVSSSGSSPSSPLILQGNSTLSATVFVQPIGTFTGTVQLSVGPLPVGVSASPATAVGVAGRAVVFNFTGSSAMQFGSAQVTITGSSGTVTNRVTVYLFMLVPPVQMTTTAPSLLLMAPGTSTNVTITLTSQNGFSGSLDVVPIGFVSGLTVTPGRQTVTLAAGGSANVTLTIAAGSSLSIPPTSPARITFEAFILLPTGSSLSLSSVFGNFLSIQVAVGDPDMALSNFTSSTAPLTIAVGGVGQAVQVTAQSLFGLSGTFTLTLSNVPAGLIANPTTTSFALAAGGTAGIPFTFTPTSSAPLGPFQVTVTATGTGLTTPRTTIIFLDIINVGFSVSVSPATSQLAPLSIGAGQSATITVSISPLNGFTGTVNLNWLNVPSDLMIANNNQNVTVGTSPVNVTFTFTAASTTTTVGVIDLRLVASSLAVGAVQNLNYFVTLGAPDFQIGGDPTLTIRADGDPAPEFVSLTALNGFTGSVVLSVSSILPSGVTVSPTTTTVSLPGVSQASFAFVASSSVPAGPISVTVTGTSGTLTHSFTFTLNVAAGTFDLTTNTAFAQPLVLSVPSSGSVVVTVTPNNGFLGTVNLVVDTSTLPPGFTVSPLGESVNITGTTPATATFTVSTTQPTNGVVEIAINGSSAALSRTATVFASAGAPTFNLFISPDSISLFPGGDGAFVAAVIQPLNNFTSPVTITISMTSAPPCIGVNPTSSTLNLAIQNKFTFHFFMTDPCAAPGATGTVTITAAGGSVTQQQTLTVTINPATFSLTLANPTGPGGSASNPLVLPTTGSQSISLTVASVNGFAGTVNLTATACLPAGYSVSLSPASVSLTAGVSVPVSLTYTVVSTPPGGTCETSVIASSPNVPFFREQDVFFVVSTTPYLFMSISAQTGSSSPLIIPQGSSGSLTITLTPQNGFGSSGPVNVTLSIDSSSPLPSGVTATFSQNPVPLGTSPVSVTMTITASSTANTNGPVTIGLDATSTVAGFGPAHFTIATGAPDFDFFEFTDTPTSPLVLVQNGAGQFAGVQVHPLNGFAGNVNLTVLSVPAGIQVNPATAIMTFPGNAEFAFFFAQATSSATVGTAQFTIQAQATINGSPVTKTQSVNLQVTNQTFTLTITPPTSPSSPLFTSGGANTFTVTVTPLNGFTGTVTLTLDTSTAPVGTIVSPASASLAVSTSPVSQIFTVTSSACSVNCAGTINITAAAGGLSETAHVSIFVGAPQFTLGNDHPNSGTAVTVVRSATPGLAAQGVTVVLAPVNGFSGTVSLVVSGVPAGVFVSPASQQILLGNAPVAATFLVSAGTSAALGLASFTVTATATGVTSGSTTVFLNVTDQTFTLSVSPGAASTAPIVLAPGASANFTVTVNPQGGFTGTVTVAVDLNSLPVGVSVSPPSASVSVSSTSPVTTPAFTFAASTAAPTPGIVGIGVQGFSPQGAHAQIALFLTVGNPSFVLAAVPPAPGQPAPTSPTLTIPPGGSGSFTLAVVPLNGFTGTVAVSLSGLPTGVTVTPATADVVLGGGSQVVVFNFSASSTVTGGSTTVTFTGTATGVSTQQFTLTLVITGAFTLSISPTAPSLSQPILIPQGGSLNVTVTVTPQSSFSGTVTIAVSGLVSGLTASPTSQSVPVSLGTPASAVFTLTASSTASLTTNVLFTGTATLSNGAPFSAQVFLPVTSGPADFSVFNVGSSTSPLGLTPGITRGFSVFIRPANGFTQNVTITFTGLPTGITVNPSTAVASLTTNFPAQFNVLADGTAAAGPASFTITVTSGSLTHTATAFIFVVTTGTFVLRDATTGSSFSVLSVVSGATITVGVSVLPVSGFVGTVDISAIANVLFFGQPAGIFPTVSPTSSSVTIAGTSGMSANFSVTVPTQAGFYGVFFNATSPQAPGFVTTFLVEFSVGQGGFTLSAFDGTNGTFLGSAPALSQSSGASLVVPTNAANVPLDVRVNATSNFSGTVVLAAATVPTGLAVSPTSASATVAAGGIATVRFAVSAATTTAPGNYQIDFTGTSGTTTLHLTVPIQVIAAPSFVLGSSPATSLNAPLFLQPSGTLVTAVGIIVQPLNTFTGDVALSLSSALPTGVTATLTPTTVSIPDSLPHTASLLLSVASGTPTFAPTPISIAGTTGTTTSTVNVFIALQNVAALRLGESASVQMLLPRFVSPGTRVRARALGRNLGAITRILAESGVQVRVLSLGSATELWIEIEVDPAVAPGTHSLLFETPYGTFAVPLQVGEADEFGLRKTPVRKQLGDEPMAESVAARGGIVTPGMRRRGGVASDEEGLPQGAVARNLGGPSIVAIEPAQVDAGAAQEVHVYGSALDNVTSVSLGNGFDVRILSRSPELVLALRVGSDVMPGTHMLRIETPSGSATGTLSIRGTVRRAASPSARRRPSAGTEDNDSNDSASGSAAAPARLVVMPADVSISPAIPRRGDTIRFQVQVRNEGGAAADGVSIQLLIPEVSVQAREVVSLGAGQSARIEFEWNTADAQGLTQSAKLHPRLVLDPDNRLVALARADRVVALGELWLEEPSGGVAEASRPTARPALRDRGTVELSLGGCGGLRLMSGSQAACGQFSELELNLSADGTQLMFLADGIRAQAANSFDGLTSVETAGMVTRQQIEVGRVYAVEAQGKLYLVRVERIQGLREALAHRLPPPLDTPQMSNREEGRAKFASRVRSEPQVTVELQWQMR